MRKEKKIVALLLAVIMLAVLAVPAQNDKFCYHVPMDNKNVFSSI